MKVKLLSNFTNVSNPYLLPVKATYDSAAVVSSAPVNGTANIYNQKAARPSAKLFYKFT